MLACIIAAPDPVEIAVSVNGHAARFAAFGRLVARDGRCAGEGTLAGLLAGLDRAFCIGATALLTVPDDMPFVPRGPAATLWPPPSCAVSHGRVHHLVPLWPVTARIALCDLLSRPGPRNVEKFAEMIGVRRVDFPLATWDSFLNVNTPADLEAVRSRADHLRTEGAALG